MHEVNVLDILAPEPGSFTIMDRGFLDFARLHRLTRACAFFVIRAKHNMAFQRVYSRAVDRMTGLRCDQTIRLTGAKTAHAYPQHLRRVVFYDHDNDKRLAFLTNNFDLPALPIHNSTSAAGRWNCFSNGSSSTCASRLFFGTSENAVKTQIWIAIAVYVLVAIIKKRLDVPASLYTILQILSLTLLEKTPLDQLLDEHPSQNFRLRHL